MRGGEAVDHRRYYFWVGPGPMWRFWGMRFGPLQVVLIFARSCWARGNRLWRASSAGTHVVRAGCLQLVWRSR